MLKPAVTFYKKSIFLLSFWICLLITISGQGNLVNFSSVPKSGTILVYAHQDDDVIWMLPWWSKTEKFIQAAVPSSPIYHTIIHNQQSYVDSHGYGIQYESAWTNPWTDISDIEYFWYYWNANTSYDYLDLDHLVTKLSSDTAQLTRTELNKMKAKLEQYIASPSVSRIITHDNWGEYGHMHHKGVNKAVRELAVKYRKDVWMLGTDGSFGDWPIPPGANITYTLANYDATLFAAIRNIYITVSSVNNYWTWDQTYIPTGNIKYIKIVDAGIDKSNILTGESVTTSGPPQDKPGSYIFNGTSDYMTLPGNAFTSFTIGMWIKPDQIRAMDISKMTEYPSATSDDRSFYMQSNGHVTARIFDGQSRTVASNTALTAGNWTHILMTGDGSALKIYINGIFENSVPAGTATTAYTTPEFVLGQPQETASYFKGQIYDVRLYDHVLTDAEIAALGNTGGTTYTITASAGTGGSISPSGSVIVSQGTNKTFTVVPNSGFQIADLNVDNVSRGPLSTYTFTNISANHIITASFSTVSVTNLTISGLTANNKVYNRSTVATLNTGSATLLGVASGDIVTLVSTGATGAFADKNAGINKSVSTSGFTITGADAANYTLTQPTTTASITPLSLAVTGVTANNKVYNATTAATLSTGSAVLVGVLSGDAVALSSAGATGTFVNKNVGTSVAVTISGLTLTGADAGNYLLTQPSSSANITRAGLTVTGVTAGNKVYDGTPAATLNTGNAVLSGVISGDAVTLSSAGATGVFANKNAGSGKTVSTSGFTISGADAANYTITQPTTTASITPLSLTITGVTANNKVYDRTTTATLNTGNLTLSGVISGDAVTLNSSGATGAFANKNAGTGKTVSTSGFALEGTDASNYALTQPSATANITTAGLNITGVTANNKVYDGTATATLNTTGAALTGVFGGDVVSVVTAGASGTFASSNIGTSIVVTISGITLGGTDASNYTLTQPSATADITGILLSITGVTANNKVYDRTATATLNTGTAALSGVVSGDAVTLSSAGATGAFTNKNAGTGKTVSTSGFTITGADAANYTLTQPTTTASITTLSLAVTGVTANNKVYNATTTATLSTGSAVLVGVLPGDAVALSSAGATGTFVNKNVGTSVAVTISGLTLTGADAGNYLLTQPSSSANITRAGLTVTGVTAGNKVYDGTPAATLNAGSAALSGVFSGDAVTLSSAGTTGVFANKNAGSGKTVSTSGFTISGADAANYTLTQPTTTASITPLSLTITGVTANNKVYDRTTTATLNTSGSLLVGVLPGDAVTLNSSGATGAFANKNAGTGKTVSTSGFALEGTDASNYALTQPSATANITTAGLNITGVTANNKVYDGTATATLNTTGAALTGVFGGDVVSVVTAGASGTFASSNIGTSIVVTISGITLGGTDASNYTLTQPSATADITGILLSITGVTANNKVYDRTATATLNTGTAALSGVVSGDAVTLSSAGATGAFTNKNAGTGKTVSTSGFTITGADAANYTLTQPTTTASITTLSLAVTGVTANNKVYNATTTATLSTGSAVLVGVLSGDAVALSSAGATGTFVNKNVGTSVAVTISGLTLTGADAGNYLLTQPSSSANITRAGLTVTGVTVGNKVYDGTPAATLNAGNAALSGVFSGDAVTLSSAGATGAFTNKNAGTGKTVSTSGFTITGADAANYTITQPTTTASITPLSLTITGVTANNKVYDRTTTATLNTENATLSGVIPGDAVTFVTRSATGTFAVKNVSPAIPVTISGITLNGIDASNYLLIQPSVSADITTATLHISGVTANNKIYDGTTTVTLNTIGAALTGVIGGDIVSINKAGVTGTFSDKNIGNAKPVSITGFSFGGTDAQNYTLVQPVTTADITAVTLTITGATANDKVYDKTNIAILNTGSAVLAGVLSGDAVNLVTQGATGTFSNKNVGVDKKVTTAGFTLSGADAGNYSLVQPLLIADITPKQGSIKVNDEYKLYGSLLDIKGFEITATGLLPGDVVPDLTVNSQGTKESAPVGTYTVSVTGGLDSNYIFIYESGTLTVNKALITVTADNQSKTYGFANPVLSISYSGFKNNEDASVLDVKPVAETDAMITSDAGNYDINISGATDKNYDFAYIKGTLTINKVEQAITFKAIPGGLRSTQQFRLTAFSSAGLPVSFETSDPVIGSLNGNTLTIHKEGKVTVTARQDGDQNRNPAPVITQTIVTLPTFDNITSLFTPNNDGMNDYWYIPDLEQYGKLEVTVYNRFGQIVYKSDSYKGDWDGTWNGYPLPSASYYYLMKSSTKGLIKGVVNIVR